jgi:hypothetical protein
MQASGVPEKFPIPFANAAGSSFIRPIPQDSQIGITAGAASLTDGFPPVTFSPVAAGGTPPWGQDMNGILHQITQWNQWQQAAGPIVYDATFQGNIGGYPMGAVIQISANGPAFMSTVDNNTVAPAAGAAGWMPVPIFGSNLTSVTETQALTAYNSGLVIVNASSGNITITMPAAASESGISLPFNFMRTDGSSNSVTLVAASGDAFHPGASSSILLSPSTAYALRGDGFNSWWLTGGNFFAGTNTWTGTNAFTNPISVGTAITPGDAVNLGQFVAGANGNGAYYAFPGGMQVCRDSMTIAANSSATWTFPLSFASPPQVFAMVITPPSSALSALWYSSISNNSGSVFNPNSTSLNVDLLAIL